MNLKVSPHPKQIEALKILSDPVIKYFAYGGAKSGGKSYLARLWLVMRAIKYPKSRSVLIRKTFPDLERSAIDKFKLEYKGVYDSYNERKKTFIFSNGSTIEMAYVQCNKDLGNYQGVEYSSVVIDESQQHNRKVYEVMKTCLRTTDKNLIPKLMLCFNWGDIGHHWHVKLFFDKIPNENEDMAKLKFLPALVYDNPSVNADYITELESLPENIRKLWLDGDPSGSLEGLCFDEFSRDLRMLPEEYTIANLKGRLFGGLDLGTSHSTGFTLCYLNQKDEIVVLFSYCMNQLTIAEHAQEIFDKIESFRFTHGLFPETIFCDPAGFTKVKLDVQSTRSPVDMFIELFKERGKPTKFVKANNGRSQGTQIMKSLMKDSKIRYFDGYNNSLVKAMEEIIIDPNDIESYLKQSTDSDDIADSFRYNIMGVYGVMADIKQRDKSRAPLTRKDKLMRGLQNNNDFYSGDMRYI